MNQPEGPAYAADPPVQLRLIDILAVVGRRRVLIASVTLGAVILAIAYVALAPKQYRATASMLVAQPKVGDSVLPATSMETYRALLQDPSLTALALNELGLDKPPHNLNASAFAAGNVEIEDVPATSLLRVHVEMPDPALAAAVANKLATGAVQLNQRLSEQEAVYATDRMREQVAQARTKLDDAQQRLLELKSASQIDLQERDADALLDQRAELLPLSIQIAGERARAERAEYELKQQSRIVDVPRATSRLGGLMESAIEQGRADAAADEKLSSRKPDTNDRDSTGRTNANDRDGRKRDDTRSGSQESDSNPRAQVPAPPVVAVPHVESPFINPVYEALMYQAATSRTRLAGLERQLSDMVSRHKVGASRLPQFQELYKQQIEQERRELELEIARKTYEDLSTRYDQARSQVANRTSQLQIVGQAVTPSRPASPRRGLVIAAAFCTALIAALFIAFFLEYLALTRAADARSADATH